MALKNLQLRCVISHFFLTRLRRGYFHATPLAMGITATTMGALAMGITALEPLVKFHNQGAGVSPGLVQWTQRPAMVNGVAACLSHG